MSIKCKTQNCKNRLAAGKALGLVLLVVTVAELIKITQVSTPFLSSPSPF